MRRGAAALLLVATLAACGGGGSSGTGAPHGRPLTTAQLVARVNAECAKLSQAAADLVSAQDPSASGTKVEHYLRAAASQLHNRVAAIAALRPPAALAGQLHGFVTLLGRYADQLDRLGRQTRARETYADLLARSTSQVNALNALSDQTNRTAAALGFTACAT